MFIKGKPANGPTPGGGQNLWVMTVSPEFMETLEIPLVRGRNLDVRDTLPNAPQVTVINEAAAKQFFAGEDPIGKRYGNSLEQNADIEIVGIAKNTKYASLRDEAPPTSFRPFAQQTTNAATFEVRTSGPPEPMIAGVREAIRKVDANLP